MSQRRLFKGLPWSAARKCTYAFLSKGYSEADLTKHLKLLYWPFFSKSYSEAYLEKLLTILHRPFFSQVQKDPEFNIRKPFSSTSDGKMHTYMTFGIPSRNLRLLLEFGVFFRTLSYKKEFLATRREEIAQKSEWSCRPPNNEALSCFALRCLGSCCLAAPKQAFCHYLLKNKNEIHFLALD